MMLLIASFKIKGIVKWRGLKSEGPLYTQMIEGCQKLEMRWMPANWTWTLNSQKYSMH